MLCTDCHHYQDGGEQLSCQASFFNYHNLKFVFNELTHEFEFILHTILS